MRLYWFILISACVSCGENFAYRDEKMMVLTSKPDSLRQVKYEEGSWPFFLQHLPVKQGPVLDYTGREIPNQQKHAGIIGYDVGKGDLQQCADALMRLRAEYLFSRKKYGEIGFHFVSGLYYSWSDYCDGLRPVLKGNSLRLVKTRPCKKTYAALRSYLDIVYNYASTISLAKELKTASGFEVGTVVISPGSPGHCFIIVDEVRNNRGENFFKLAEGYTPAQSIYILRNPSEDKSSPWYSLSRGTISTSSYVFTNYKLGKFE